MNEKIQVFYSPNEKGSSRETALAKACMDDNRFLLPEPKDIRVDVQFRLSTWKKTVGTMDLETAKTFNCELKEPADYVSSVLGKDGHAYMQYLDMAEAGHRCMFLVLGSDKDVSDAIYDSLKTRYRGSELAFQISSYEKRLQDFEAQCWGLHAPVERWKAAPYQRLLSTAHKVLTGSSLAAYGPRPAENERESTAFQCLLRGIGPKLSGEILKDYRVALVPRLAYSRPIEEMPGIGSKRAQAISGRIVMFYEAGLQ